MSISRIDPVLDFDDVMCFLLDPNSDVSFDGWAVIDDVRKIWSTREHTLEVCDLVQNLLLRLRKDSPEVFAISVGQFRDWDGIEDFWNEYGYIDSTGAEWPVPRVRH